MGLGLGARLGLGLGFRVRVNPNPDPNPNPNPNRSKGCQYFDEAADNLTGVLVNLDGLVYASSSSQA